MERRLGLVQGDLDARGRVLDVECLGVGKTRVLVRVEVEEVTGFLGEDGTLGNPLNEKRVVVAEQEPLEISRHRVEGSRGSRLLQGTR